MRLITAFVLCINHTMFVETPAYACSQASVFDVRILPTSVVVVGRKSVAGIVACLADYDPANGSFFEMRLVDVDEEIGEVAGPNDPLGDDVLGAMAVAGADPGTTDLLPIAGGRIFTVRCDNTGMVGTGTEGSQSNLADLALHITDGDSVFRAAPNEMVVPAICEENSDAPKIVALVYTGQTGVPDFPEVPPSMDLGYGARFRLQSGGSHLEFITAAGGPLPGAVRVNVVRAASALSEQNPPQELPLALTVTGEGSFVAVTGTVTMDGVVEAAGRGTVAGFENIEVTLTGTLRGGTLDGEYSMGTGGQLPGGFPIVFELAGTSEEFAEFWRGTGEGLFEIADNMALFNFTGPIGGVNLEDALTRQAANLAIAQSAFVNLPQTGVAEAAFAGVAERIEELAAEVESSALLGAAPAAGGFREAALAARQSGTQFGELRRMPPGAALNDRLTAFVGSLESFDRGLRASEQGAFGNGLLATVSAASFAPGPAALDAIVSGFGPLDAPVEVAESLPLPAALGGLSVTLSDREGADHTLGLFFSSGGQANFLMPAEAAEGIGLLTATLDGAVVAASPIAVVRVAPSVFTANASGEGAPAALVLRVAPNGQQTFLDAFAGSPGSFEPAPIDVGDGAEYFLLLFGSGFRHASAVTARIGAESAIAVPFAASAQFVGLDQANVPLSPALAGAGELDLVLEADGIAANAVQLRLQ